jgi:hypothetical protein
MDEGTESLLIGCVCWLEDKGGLGGKDDSGLFMVRCLKHTCMFEHDYVPS